MITIPELYLRPSILASISETLRLMEAEVRPYCDYDMAESPFCSQAYSNEDGTDSFIECVHVKAGQPDFNVAFVLWRNEIMYRWWADTDKREIYDKSADQWYIYFEDEDGPNLYAVSAVGYLA